MDPQIEILLIAAIVGVACTLPGIFLILRKVSMLSDAISHTVLLGIVVGFLFVGNVNSPILIIAAAATGLLTVLLAETLIKSGKIKQDASIGIVFPLLFSIAVIILNKLLTKIHLDTHMVLVGELAFAPFDRIAFIGFNLPKSMVIMTVILLINALFIIIFYKELKLSTFDAGLAVSLGFSPVILHYLLMSIVSITIVGAFDSVGSILVVGLIIAPAATAYLLTDKLSTMILFGILLSIVSSTAGFFLARAFDGSIAGSMSMMLGLIFSISLLFSPKHGLVHNHIRRKKQKYSFPAQMLLVHLIDHQGKKGQEFEMTLPHLFDHFNWTREHTSKVVNLAQKKKWIKVHDKRITPTEVGKNIAKQVMKDTKLIL